MIEKIVVPSLGMSFEYVTLVKWLKDEGDYVKNDEIIAEVTSDKISMEIASSMDGYLRKRLYSENELVPAKEAIAIVSSKEDEEIPEEYLISMENQDIPKENDFELSKTVKDEDFKDREKLVSPAARRIIKEENLDVSKIKGTGKDGLITRKDVEEFLENSSQEGEVSIADKEIEGIEILETIPYTGIRKVIGDNLAKSVNTAVHVTTGLEVDMTEAIELRKRLKEEKGFENLSILTFVLRAMVEAIKEYPILNSELKDQQILVKKSINIGIGVSTPNGLIVPVIKGVEKMGFRSIANEIQIVTQKGRDNSIGMEDLTGGTITLSNAGAFGALTSTPIISYPQCAVVWMGKAVKKPALVDGEIAIRSIMNLLTSYDHRIVDGSIIAQFLSKMKSDLEMPELLLIND